MLRIGLKYISLSGKIVCGVFSHRFSRMKHDKKIKMNVIAPAPVIANEPASEAIPLELTHPPQGEFLSRRLTQIKKLFFPFVLLRVLRGKFFPTPRRKSAKKIKMNVIAHQSVIAPMHRDVPRGAQRRSNPAKINPFYREGFSAIYVMGWKLFSIYNPSPALPLKGKGERRKRV